MAALKLGPVAAVGIGAVFVYAGVRGFSILKAAQNVIQGQSPQSGQSASLLAQSAGTTSGGSNSGGTSGGGSPGGSPQAIARGMLSRYGWGASEFGPLDNIWTRESGWRWNATNPSSGAYGIPQALPGSKMASAGADWRTNPATQIKWGLGYIKSRYGSPSKAWAFWQANGWY